MRALASAEAKPPKFGHALPVEVRQLDSIERTPDIKGLQRGDRTFCILAPLKRAHGHVRLKRDSGMKLRR